MTVDKVTVWYCIFPLLYVTKISLTPVPAVSVMASVCEDVVIDPVYVQLSPAPPTLYVGVV